MRIPLNVKVQCTDGSSGKLTTAVVDRNTRKITHLVVHGGGLGSADWVVPLEALTGTSPNSVTLGITKAQLAGMSGFNVTTSDGTSVPFINPDGTNYGWDMAWTFQPEYEPSHTGGPSGTMKDTASVVSHQNIDSDQVAVRYGTKVKAANANVGFLQDLLVDENTKEVTHIVMRDKNLVGGHAISVPIEDIDRVYRGVIELTLDKAQLHELPAYKG